MGKIVEYTNDKITVVWKLETCIHSAKCVHGLPEVFKPKERRWIQMENATTEKIITAIKDCPSSALSYYMNDEGKPQDKQETQLGVTKVEIIENGPLMVHGALSVKHANGSQEQKKRVTAFCRCGKTDNKPYCDGSHNA